MEQKVISRENLGKWLDAIAREYDLIAPTMDDDIVLFKEVKSAARVVLDYNNTVLPAKDHFFPQTETVFRFKAEAGQLAIEPEPPLARPRVLFGVRPCDLKSIALLDHVFDGDFQDAQYLDKRARTVLVGLGCNTPQPTCFCGSFGIEPGSSPAADLFFTEIESGYLVNIQSEKGKEALQKGWSFFADPDAGQVKEASERAANAKKALKLSLDTRGVKEELDHFFESPYWDEISPKCLTCGICTYICPTCHCFDINDTSGQTGERFRCWDSCMFTDFTRMAGGHNPRPTKKERVRQRFLHKLRYFPDRYKEYACVGCGRCLQKCPVHMDITQIISDVKGGKLQNAAK